ncbi:MAG: hypothetical protein EAS48_09140 [Chryseobacterium sp.]|nr:MAG: hypothetical protein EAS48_09140 [Chryseobacterium sp.]
MKYRVVTLSAWFTGSLARKVESTLNELTADGYEIIGVSFSFNILMIPKAFITVTRSKVISA